MFANVVKKTKRCVNSAQRIYAMRNVHKKEGGQKYPLIINTCTLDAHPCMHRTISALTIAIIYMKYIK